MSRQFRCQGFLFAALSLFALCCAAEPVANLFEADVPVAGQDAPSRDVAARAALEAVLVKAAGTDRVLENPVVAAAVRQASGLMLQFYFKRAEHPPREGEANAEELALHASFQPESVLDILRRAGEPVLSPNRPSTLAWVAIDDGTGPRLLNRETDATVADWLGFHAARRAVPLLFPLLDIEDSMAVAPEQVWALEADGALQASARYAANSLLVARLVRTAEGGWMGEWRQILGEESIYGQGSADSVDALLGQMADAVAEMLAARFAVQTGLEHASQLRLRVDGVASFGAYRQLTALLKGMAAVSGARLVLIDRDTLFFDLVTASDYEAVVRELALLGQVRSEGDAGELRYRWIGG